MMRRIFLLACVLVLAVPVTAQRVTTYEQITVAASSIGIASATRAGMAMCSLRLETAQIRWRADGTAPTTTVGTLMEIGDVMTIANILDAMNIRFIRTGGTSGVLNVSCFPQP